MRTSIIAAFLCLLAFTGISNAETVRVLIIDQGFQRIPPDGEDLKLLDAVSGELLLGGSTADYRGEFTIWKGESGLYLINELPLEQYVAGVVEAETAPNWAEEALKAQAVAVRTYVLYNMRNGNSGRVYHVTSSVLHQVYRGKSENSRITKAVQDTKGEVMVFGGEPIAAYYHSTSADRTERPEEVFGKSYPYLDSVEANCRLSPMSYWTRKIPLEEVSQALGLVDISDIKLKSRTSTGRVKELAFVTSGRDESSYAQPEGGTGLPYAATIPDVSGEVVMEAKDLRKILGWRRLPSTDFTFELQGSDLVVKGRGYGHGVGMCQWSSLEMALGGRTYREILSHFYKGTDIRRYEDL